MGARSGRDMLLKIKNDAGADITVAGLRSKRLILSAKPVDITHTQSKGAWRECLAGAGVKSVDITGEGIFCDSASDTLLRSFFFEQSVHAFQIAVSNFGVLEGDFVISALHYLGSYSAESKYEITLNSAGLIHFKI